MDILIHILSLIVQLTTAGGALGILRWFAGRILDLFERRLAVIEAKVTEVHAAVVPGRLRFFPDQTDPDPPEAA